ncbi:receptor-type tyrosine-protein phosphatase H isoform X3 [Gasterosteus aculeatus]
MKPFSFKITPEHFLLCVSVSLLWVSNAAVQTSVMTAKAMTTVTTATQTTTPTTKTPTTPTATTTTATTPLLTTKKPPGNVNNVTVSARNETSITLKWEKVDDISTYFLRSEAMTPMDVPINDTTGGSSVEYVVTSLTAGKKYSFTIITTFEGANSTGFSYEAVTAPGNVNNVTVSARNETSITLKWEKVGGIPTYFLRSEAMTPMDVPINDTTGGSSVEYVVTSLTAGKKYSFTIITTFEGANSTGFSYEAVTAPGNVNNVTVSARNETSITLKWEKVGGIPTYFLRSEAMTPMDVPINDTTGGSSVEYVVTSLTAGKKYSFTIITTFEGANSTGFSYEAVTAPGDAKGLKTLGQTETSITLQWEKVKDILQYKLVFNKTEINITATGGDYVNHTIPNLTCGTRYNFTLFTLFDQLNSTGVNSNAVTVPCNAEELKTLGQTETSITLQWKKRNDILQYKLVFNKTEINVTATGGGYVNHTIPNLTCGTRYNFTLFTLFDQLNSRGVNGNAVTVPCNAEELKTLGQTETSITLQWKKRNDILQYKLVFNKTEINVTATGGGYVNHTIPNLTCGTRYNFTLFTLFDQLNSRGVNGNAVTVPCNAEELKTLGQTETSITLQWKKRNDILQYKLVFNKTEINVTATGGGYVNHTIPNLTCGTRYNFTLFTLFDQLNSRGVNGNAVTVPCNAEELKTLGQTETSITLQWKKRNDILQYKLVFNKTEINVTATGGGYVNHTIPNLTCGTRYNFTLFTLFDQLNSRGVNGNAVTVPCNAKELKTLGQTETSITLQWKKVDKILQYKLVFNQTENNVTATGGDYVNHTIPNLTSGTRYNFTVLTEFGNVTSSGVTYSASTVPPPVTSVNVTKRSATSVTLQWQTVNQDWEYNVNGTAFQLSPSTTGSVSHSFSSLTPGTLYNFSVVTTFSGLHSRPYEDFTVTALHCSWNVTNSSIQGAITGLFSKATATNGTQNVNNSGSPNVLFAGLWPGATYQVSLVYEKQSRSFLQCRHNVTILPSYLTAHCEHVDAGYSVYVVWSEPRGVWTSVEVNVSGHTRSVLPNEKQEVKISGFQPARNYEVSLHSKSGQRSSGEPFVFSCLTDPRGVIAGAVFAVLIFCLLVFLAVFIFFKRPDIISRKNPFIGGTRQSIKKIKDISVAKFPEHFYQLSMDEGRGFSEEYESLVSVGMEQTKAAALLPQNKPRNRFNNVLPYDWCRVKLSTLNPNEASDYINACYMPGYKSDRDYIATQGPLPATVSDFWRMIWEQRVKGIVMVTNCTEGGRTKCEQYWPADRKPCSHGELSVSTRFEQKEPNWTLREFRVKHRHYSEERTVRHFHFTAWPDHGVPQGTGVLIQFRGLVRRHIEGEGAEAPTVVHCSAGVGRTGTIIALDVLLQQLERERAVGINAFVRKMRLSRPHMVQTESQYVFLHQCIMDCLQKDEEAEENIYENAEMIYTNATALRELTRA